MISALVLLAALGPGIPALPAGSYRYSATLAGTVAGSSTLTVADRGSTTNIDETASGSAQGLSFSGNASLVLGADLVPTQYDGSYVIAGQQARVAVALTPTTATVNASTTGGQPQTYALDPNGKHFVVIEPGLLAGFFALPAQMRAWNDAAVTALAPALGTEEPIAPTAAPTSSRPPGVPAGDAGLAVGGRMPFTVWYDPATMIPDQIVIPSQDATITRVRD